VITKKLETTLKGQAYVSVLKALVTQSSSAIPVMPLYISALYKVMKEQGTHEGCIEQIYALMFEQLYSGKALNLDDSGRIRMEDKELEDTVQKKVAELWSQVNTNNLDELTDFNGYQAEFFRLFGFGFENVDYEADVDPIV
jgi:enoyl-[acyl-carrier protein] reductase/trans-2-enoyl-CoA reductase (NAD+)